MLKMPTTHPGTPLCSSKLVLRATVLAQAVAILLALAPGAVEDRWFRLGLSTLFVQWVALLTLLLLCQLQKYRPNISAKRLAACAFAILLTCTTLVSLAAFVLLTEKGWEPQVNLSWFILHNLTIALIVGIIGLQFYLMHLERNQRIAAQSRAELDALQARIRPHFLFNSLNTAAELTREDPEAAEAALLNLSSLFRAALNAGEASTLKAEIALAKAYIDLERWRLGDRLSITWDLPDPLPDTPLPALTLQPLLENAVGHGIERITTGGSISVSLLQSEQNITLLITNPAGEKPARLKGNGMAIDNIRKRLELLSGEQAKLITGTIDNHYRVKLVIPYAHTDR
ncbi:sensor histidine kinase [Nitrincola iocasae]|uniref:Sensor histidine kinase n=1 Tax=Nitrincola iocasae TaxID=2614693 RepID=A0A5J6LA62_9GAMM|nr:histidine kinase [Nitrincola iocasae]QEW05261.1 sensor histidine kinase [Nitrincola iocasae]